MSAAHAQHVRQSEGRDVVVEAETLELAPAGETPALVRFGFYALAVLGFAGFVLFVYFASVGSNFVVFPVIFLVPGLAFWLLLWVLRGSARTPVVMVCDSDRVSLRRWGGETDVYWHSVTRVHVRHAPDRRDGLSYGEAVGRTIVPTFPAYLIVQAGESSPMGMSGTPDSIALAPEYLTAKQLLTVLEWFLAHCAPRTIDPEVLLMYGAISRLIDVGATATWATTADGRLSTQKVSQALQHEPGAVAVKAAFSYFTGLFREAASESSMVLKTDHHAWDMLLCAALCARVAGDQSGAAALLAPTMSAASESDRVRTVLEAAVDVGESRWYDPVL